MNRQGLSNTIWLLSLIALSAGVLASDEDQEKIPEQKAYLIEQPILDAVAVELAEKGRVDALQLGLNQCAGLYAGLGIIGAYVGANIIAAAVLGGPIVLEAAVGAIAPGLVDAAATTGALSSAATANAANVAAMGAAEGALLANNLMIAAANSGATAAEIAATTAAFNASGIAVTGFTPGLGGLIASTGATAAAAGAAASQAAAAVSMGGILSSVLGISVKAGTFLWGLINGGIIMGIPTSVPQVIAPQEADPVTKCYYRVFEKLDMAYWKPVVETAVTAPAYLYIENETPYYIIVKFKRLTADRRKAREKFAIPPNSERQGEHAKHMMFGLGLDHLEWIGFEALDHPEVRPVYGKRPGIGLAPAVNEVLAGTLKVKTLSNGKLALQLEDTKGLEGKAMALGRREDMNIIGTPWIDQDKP